MPQFMDFHAQMPAMSPEQAQEGMAQMKKHIESGQSNELGVRPINVYFGTGGQAYCLSEAPNADAVLKAHEANNVPQTLGNIHEVNSVV